MGTQPKARSRPGFSASGSTRAGHALQVEALPLEGLFLLTPPRQEHEQGLTSPVWPAALLARIGMVSPFVQDHYSLWRHRDMVRGLHAQVAPHAQGRLVRCTRGAIWDVAVDVRTGSPTFGQWVGVTLSAENGSQFWIPPGFLNGLCTLTDQTEVFCQCTTPSDHSCARSLRWNDATLGIEWPVTDGQAIVSGHDAAAPPFSAVIDWFHYA
ncbi:dTDP-4-dehydrorhamnose 3,5-epimerase family protein [Komagataeibacter xylinus]|uniref:dTDP-4-dehydrorhamnose 3,5-epimerase n=1 Tax=Komagataeibacter xylinus TaxID=28448 RepID=A0A857FNI0_KOMXY|nr:dTDP-4-dehydrorhamnose 3,5-epimerase family protein [Komagataeibacter xylinus]QHC35059.1 dTDP-4-keto-6-deoxy-D-glucose epimerase [Komagataeibacter xylinus]